MTNYRPTSLLTTFSKALEVMYNRLIHHMHTNNTLGPEQFGRKGTATEDVALKLRDCVLKWVYPKVYVGGTFCDLVQTLV
jgi:hypothetical protein